MLSSGQTPVIDFHVHVYPDALAPRVLASFLKYPIKAYSDGTANGWLTCMDDCGVETSVLLSVPTRPAQVEPANRFLAQFLDNSRLIPFAGVHPECDDAVGIIRQAAEQGFSGIKLHPLMQHFKPQERRMFPLYDAAIAEGLVVVFHAGAGMDYDDIRGSKQDFDELFERYDYDRFVVAHLGGRPDFQAFPAFKDGWPGYLDLAFSLGLMPDDYLVNLVRSFGVDRVLFGTDGPWHGLAEDLASVLSVGFSDEELRAMLYGNAARLLGLAPCGCRS
jgi:predicted TIM-barrel fold metal-dependent hydrolase